jgi:hypothetical protein
VSLFLYAFIDDSENRLLPNNVMMIRNYGEDKEGLKERRGGAKEQQRPPNQVGVPIRLAKTVAWIDDKIGLAGLTGLARLAARSR